MRQLAIIVGPISRFEAGALDIYSLECFDFRFPAVIIVAPNETTIGDSSYALVINLIVGSALMI